MAPSAPRILDGEEATVKAQDELVVHEVTLDGGEGLAEESFLGQGRGSHFESRVSELVVIKPSSAGLPRLPDKVEQLVGKGFHNLVVSLGALPELGNPELQVLTRVRSYLGTWAGSLRLCDATAQVRHKLELLGVDDGLAIHDGREAAISEYRRSLDGAEAALDPGQSADLGADSGDSVASPNDWGWGAAPDEPQDDGTGLPRVDVAEVFAQADELTRLDTDLRKVVNGGKRYVSLRVHFDRPVRSDDVDHLAGSRDYLAREGGQLALVALPQEVLKWLQMLEFDREFLIVESADEAELAHRRHAAGHGSGASAPAARPSVAAAPPTELDPAPAALDPVSSIEFESGISLAVDEGPVASGGVPQAELDRVQAEVSRLHQQLGALEQRARGAEGERDAARGQAQELQRRQVELQQGRDQALRRATEVEASVAAARAGQQQAEEELQRLRAELEAARATQSAQSADAGRVGALEAAVQEKEESLALLNAELDSTRQQLSEALSRPAAVATVAGDAGELGQRVQQLEEEKARILAEAEQEIERLTREHEILREELESAGEMIERLGKELELS